MVNCIEGFKQIEIDHTPPYPHQTNDRWNLMRKKVAFEVNLLFMNPNWQEEIKFLEAKKDINLK